MKRDRGKRRRRGGVPVRYAVIGQGYFAQAGHPKDIAATLSRSPEVIEQCVNALCGSLIDFKPDGTPVLGAASDQNQGIVNRTQFGAGEWRAERVA